MSNALSSLALTIQRPALSHRTCSPGRPRPGFLSENSVLSQSGTAKISGMDEETLKFFNWQLEQDEVEQIKAAIKRADSGHLVDHAKLKETAAGWCKIEPSKLDAVVIPGRKDARINWTDAAVKDLQRTCEYMTRSLALYERPGSRARNIAESHVKNVLATVELIASHPDVGRPGLVNGTREWGMESSSPTIAYRHLLGEIQVLAMLASHRKWPLMKSAPSWWNKKSVS